MPESELLINSSGQVGGPGTCSNYIVGNLLMNSDSSLYVGQDWANCGLPIPPRIFQWRSIGTVIAARAGIEPL